MIYVDEKLFLGNFEQSLHHVKLIILRTNKPFAQLQYVRLKSQNALPLRAQQLIVYNILLLRSVNSQGAPCQNTIELYNRRPNEL